MEAGGNKGFANLTATGEPLPPRSLPTPGQPRSSSHAVSQVLCPVSVSVSAGPRAAATVAAAETPPGPSRPPGPRLVAPCSPAAAGPLGGAPPSSDVGPSPISDAEAARLRREAARIASGWRRVSLGDRHSGNPVVLGAVAPVAPMEPLTATATGGAPAAAAAGSGCGPGPTGYGRGRTSGAGGACPEETAAVAVAAAPGMLSPQAEAQPATCLRGEGPPPSPDAAQARRPLPLPPPPAPPQHQPLAPQQGFLTKAAVKRRRIGLASGARWGLPDLSDEGGQEPTGAPAAPFGGSGGVETAAPPPHCRPLIEPGHGCGDSGSAESAAAAVDSAAATDSPSAAADAPADAPSPSAGAPRSAPNGPRIEVPRGAESPDASAAVPAAADAALVSAPRTPEQPLRAAPAMQQPAVAYLYGAVVGGLGASPAQPPPPPLRRGLAARAARAMQQWAGRPTQPPPIRWLLPLRLAPSSSAPSTAAAAPAAASGHKPAAGSAPPAAESAPERVPASVSPVVEAAPEPAAMAVEPAADSAAAGLPTQDEFAAPSARAHSFSPPARADVGSATPPLPCTAAAARHAPHPAAGAASTAPAATAVPSSTADTPNPHASATPVSSPAEASPADPAQAATAAPAAVARARVPKQRSLLELAAALPCVRSTPVTSLPPLCFHTVRLADTANLAGRFSGGVGAQVPGPVAAARAAAEAWGQQAADAMAAAAAGAAPPTPPTSFGAGNLAPAASAAAMAAAVLRAGGQGGNLPTRREAAVPSHGAEGTDAEALAERPAARAAQLASQPRNPVVNRRDGQGLSGEPLQLQAPGPAHGWVGGQAGAGAQASPGSPTDPQLLSKLADALRAGIALLTQPPPPSPPPPPQQQQPPLPQQQQLQRQGQHGGPGGGPPTATVPALRPSADSCLLGYGSDGGGGGGGDSVGRAGWRQDGSDEDDQGDEPEPEPELLPVGLEEAESLPHLDLRDVAPSVARTVTAARMQAFLESLRAACGTPCGRGRWARREEIFASQRGMPVVFAANVLSLLRGVRIGGYAVLRARMPGRGKPYLYRLVRLPGTPDGAPLVYTGELPSAPAAQPPSSSSGMDQESLLWNAAGGRDAAQRQSGHSAYSVPPPLLSPGLSLPQLWCRLQEARAAAAAGAARAADGTDIAAEAREAMGADVEAAAAPTAAAEPEAEAGAEPEVGDEAVLPMEEALAVPELDLSGVSYVAPKQLSAALSAVLPVLQRLCSGGRRTTRVAIEQELGAGVTPAALSSVLARLRGARLGGYVVCGALAESGTQRRGAGRLLEYRLFRIEGTPEGTPLTHSLPPPTPPVSFPAGLGQPWAQPAAPGVGPAQALAGDGGAWHAGGESGRAAERAQRQDGGQTGALAVEGAAAKRRRVSIGARCADATAVDGNERLCGEASLAHASRARLGEDEVEREELERWRRQQHLGLSAADGQRHVKRPHSPPCTAAAEGDGSTAGGGAPTDAAPQARPAAPAAAIPAAATPPASTPPAAPMAADTPDARHVQNASPATGPAGPARGAGPHPPDGQPATTSPAPPAPHQAPGGLAAQAAAGMAGSSPLAASPPLLSELHAGFGPAVPRPRARHHAGAGRAAGRTGVRAGRGRGANAAAARVPRAGPAPLAAGPGGAPPHGPGAAGGSLLGLALQVQQMQQIHQAALQRQRLQILYGALANGLLGNPMGAAAPAGPGVGFASPLIMQRGAPPLPQPLLQQLPLSQLPRSQSPFSQQSPRPQSLPPQSPRLLPWQPLPIHSGPYIGATTAPLPDGTCAVVGPSASCLFTPVTGPSTAAGITVGMANVRCVGAAGDRTLPPVLASVYRQIAVQSAIETVGNLVGLQRRQQQ